MKKYLVGFLAGSLLFGGTSTYASIGKSIEVLFGIGDIKIDQNSAKIENESFIYNDKIYVPLKSIGEKLGYRVQWDPKNRVAYLNKQLSEINIPMHKIKSVLSNEFTLNPITKSYFTFVDVKPESFEIGEKEHIYLYTFKSVEERQNAQNAFQLISDRADMIPPCIFEVGNNLIFYVPSSGEYTLKDRIEKSLQSLESEGIEVVTKVPF